MNKIQDIKQSIKDAQDNIAAEIKKLDKLFDTELAELIKANIKTLDGLTLDSIYISVNNHEFNDGGCYALRSIL